MMLENLWVLELNKMKSLYEVSNRQYSRDMLISMFSMFPYIFIHEYGHILMAYLQGIPLIYINPNPIAFSLHFAQNTFLIGAGGLLISIPFLIAFYCFSGVKTNYAYYTLMLGILIGSSADIYNLLRMLLGTYPF